MSEVISGRRRPATGADSERPAPRTNPVRPTCDVCRSRKTRCDRAAPKCGRCTRLGLPCGYDGRRQPSRDEISGQLLDLQDRLAKAEARLSRSHSQQMTPPAFPTPAGASDIACMPPSIYGAASQQLRSPSSGTRSRSRSSPMDMDALERSVLPALEYDPFVGSADTIAEFPCPGADLDWSPIQMPDFDSPIPALNFDTTANGRGRDQDDDGLSRQELDRLHRGYFDVIYFALPFLCQKRFLADLASRPQSPSVLSLSYAVALLGTTLDPSLSPLQPICYNLARKYIDVCERSESDEDLANINLFQALLFVIRYEITHRPLVTAWMTLGRAIRLAKMFGLHEMDGDASMAAANESNGLRIHLPHASDELQLEERRRSFWCLYVLESYVSTRTGMPCELGETQSFETQLPSPGLLVPSFSAIRMPFLRDMTSTNLHTGIPISSYAGCVLMVELALKCFAHDRRRKSTDQKLGFWDSHYALTKAFNERATSLREHLNAKAIQQDPVAFSLHLNLCATEIYFHGTAISEAERQELPSRIASESLRRSTTAAFKISNAIRLNWPNRRSERDIFTLQATFVAWPLVMATKALGRDLANSEPNVSSNGMAHSLRLLQAALDLTEQPAGYWHSLTAAESAILKEWDEKSGFENAVL